MAQSLPWNELGSRAFGQSAHTAIENNMKHQIHISYITKFSKIPKSGSIWNGETMRQFYLTFLAASLECSSLFAPVQTIFPEANTSAVVLGSLILMITAAKRCQNSIKFKVRLQLINECNLFFGSTENVQSKHNKASAALIIPLGCTLRYERRWLCVADPTGSPNWLWRQCSWDIKQQAG